MTIAKTICGVMLVAAVLAARSGTAATTIVVNCGVHASAEDAASSEDKVNWLDDDPRDDTACTECFAAVELQHYLRKMTGRAEDFATAKDDQAPAGDLILVGGPQSNRLARSLGKILGSEPKDLEGLGLEGYRLQSAVRDGRRVTLVAGGGRVGTLYAAYDLLHRLGCRWFAPGEVHEEIPRIEGIPDVDATERPSFLIRGFHAWEDRAPPEFLRWMARNRLNLWCVEQRPQALMHKLGIQMAGGSHDAEAVFLNPASYFKTHPEWFAMVDGKRVPGIQGEFGTNYCTSNPDATAEFMKNYVRSLVDGPFRNAGVMRFWTLDGGKWCQCPQCKALGTPTDRYLLLVHRFDQEIKKAQADGRIRRPVVVHFLVYADVLAPPTRPLPPTFDYRTCVATFFPIVRCYAHNFDDLSCSPNVRYSQALRGWLVEADRHYRGQICIGEYYNVSGYQCLPVCFMHTMAHDIPYYHRLGARDFHYMHVTTANWGNKALTNYQMARQLWEVGADCPALWEDYFARRYGGAAATMRRFYESLGTMLCGVSELKYGLARRLNTGGADLFPSARLRYELEPGRKTDEPTFMEIVGHSRVCRELIDQAAAAALPERIKARIAEDERMFTYGERTIAYYHACVQGFQSGRAGRLDEARGHLAEARRITELLRADGTSARATYGKGMDAFAASYATGAIQRLESLVGRKP